MPSSNEDKSEVKLSLPLEYQQGLYHELQAEDEIVVLARGLGLLRIVTNLLHSYEAAGESLILLVNADERENRWIGEALAELAAVNGVSDSLGLREVNTDSMSIDARESLYQSGGVLSVTSRILIVDLLVGLLDVKTITGIAVLHADTITATSTEAFILRVYRQANKHGFLKAFADNPIPLAMGFAPLASMMRNLFVKKASLWPRFHVTVARALEGKKRAEVIDLEVPMTEAMQDIQGAILECIETSIKELKKGSYGLEMEEWTVDNAMASNFDQIIRRQLDPNWHRTSYRTKQIVNDLRTLRDLLNYLLTYDAVTFNKHLDIVLENAKPPPNTTLQNQSPWLFLDASHIIFSTAKQRIYTAASEQRATNSSGVLNAQNLQPILEEQPKWAVLSDTLDEINRDIYFNPATIGGSSGTILIMCSDTSTCRQIREYLQTMHIKTASTDRAKKNESEEASANFMMRERLHSYLSWKPKLAATSKFLQDENQKILDTSKNDRARLDSQKGKPPPNKRRRIRGGGASSASYREANGGLGMKLEDPMELDGLTTSLQPIVVDDEDEAPEDYFELFDMEDLLLVHAYEGDLDEQLLEETKPRYIIMYEPDASFVRRVEVYRSSHRHRDVKVYFMYYGGSVEEQRYLKAVRREKDAFEKLIRERGSMALTLTTDVRSADPQEMFLRTVNTRIAGGGRLAATAAPPSVVIDIREFRSALPGLLHGHGIQIVPCTLTVGDYVLTPDLVVERKSVTDLIGSLNSGRLFNQAETMLKHYKNAALLVEFDANKSFTLEAFTDFAHPNSTKAANKNPTDLSAKLVMLTIAFPRLRVIWSSSAHQTSLIFQSLKTQSPEPNPAVAVKIGLEPGQEEAAEDVVWNQDPQDMLRFVGGVTAKNIDSIILGGGTLQDVANWELKEAEQILGKENGGQLYRFFNKQLANY